MQSDLKGINEITIDNLILDILDYNDKIKSVFNSIENLVNNTNNFYISESGNKYREKFNKIKINFDIVNNNIIGITDDLVKVKSNFQILSDELSVKINKDASNF